MNAHCSVATNIRYLFFLSRFGFHIWMRIFKLIVNSAVVETHTILA